jgi:Galactose oxidase, central domain/Kelch motif
MFEAHPQTRVATLANGRVMALYEHDGGLRSELYDPSTGLWAQGPAPPTQRASTLVPLADGGALLIGETVCQSPEKLSSMCLPTSAAYRLEPSDLAWSQISPMLVPRTRPTAVRLADGRVLIAAGFGDACTTTEAFGYSCAPLASAEIFDPKTNVWSSAASLPSAAGGASAVLLSSGDVLLAGGATGDRHEYERAEDAYRYDPAANDWSVLPSPPFSVTGSTLLPLAGNRAIALGSEPQRGFYGSLGAAGSAPLVICNSIPEIYTPIHDTWTPAPPLPGNPISCATDAALLSDGQILYDSGNGYALLDAKQQCWGETPPPPAEHDGVLSPLLEGGALNAASGNSGLNPWSGSETYTPLARQCSIAQQITTSLFANSAPQGYGTLIPTILKAAYRTSIHAIKPGRLTVRWLAKIPTAVTTERILLATGHANINRPGTASLQIALTRHGRELLENSDTLNVTAQASLKISNHRTITSSRPFTASR